MAAYLRLIQLADVSSTQFSSDGALCSTAEDGTNLLRLTATSTDEENPAWSPGGSSIVLQLSHWETIDP
jgi:hypothetical protein